MSELRHERLDAVHEQRLAELAAPLRAVEAQAFARQSLVGEFRRLEGISEYTDWDEAGRLVEEARAAKRKFYGRDLDDGELAAARRQAERQAVVTTGGQRIQSSHELAALHGWGVSTRPRPGQGEGMATRIHGEWTADSDPKVTEAVEAAEEAKQAEADAAYHAWRAGPGKSIGPPT